ncbi:glycosyltransferase [Tardiphaga sp. 813_E8_N1_3]|uniref:glycosyltransferase n=1 Tax=Tardiphaga sp. 813_E8_N1_3 TaxID=3240760 RepID=UPI003F26E0D8
MNERAPESSLSPMEVYTAERKRHWGSRTTIECGNNAAPRAYRRTLAHLYRFLVPQGARVLEVGCGSGDLLAAVQPSRGYGIDFSEERLERVNATALPRVTFHNQDAHSFRVDEAIDYVILSDLVDDLWDVEAALRNLAGQISPDTRVIINSYSKIWEWPLWLARKFRLATPLLRQNWLSPHDIQNIARLAGFECVSTSPEILLPLDIPILSTLFNRYLVRLWPFRLFALTNFYVLRKRTLRPEAELTVSVIVPARNEAGHIADLLRRIPKMGRETEVIFVEGNSTDDTFEVIQRELSSRTDITSALYKQDKKGKRNAVELGFAKASGDILMILDADISVLPEDLPKFLRAWSSGAGEFINGVRLVYPMEGNAMRPLNLLGNRAFSLAISWVLGQKLQDTLCGTKVLHRDQYAKIVASRSYFGDFDPFGDFDLIFGAAKQNLQIIDLPIRYHERVYGETNIARWRHGVILLKMVLLAARKFKFR